MKSYEKVAEIVSETSGKTYTISRDEKGVLSCNCPSWIFKSRKTMDGTSRYCKHLRQYHEERG